VYETYFRNRWYLVNHLLRISKCWLQVTQLLVSCSSSVQSIQQKVLGTAIDRLAGGLAEPLQENSVFDERCTPRIQGRECGQVQRQLDCGVPSKTASDWKSSYSSNFRLEQGQDWGGYLCESRKGSGIVPLRISISTLIHRAHALLASC
jgi:hypothetical protein